MFERLRLPYLLSKDDLAVVGGFMSEGVMFSVLKRSDDGVPGRLVWEGLFNRAAEAVRMCRGVGRRDDGKGAYAVGKEELLPDA